MHSQEQQRTSFTITVIILYYCLHQIMDRSEMYEV